MKRFFRFLAAVALMCGFASTAHAESGEKKDGFFKAAFRDMKQSAKLQRQIDRTNYQAIKLESKAFYQERLSNPKVRSAAEKERMERQLAEANARLERAKANK